MTNRRVIFPPTDYWTRPPQENPMTDFNPDDVIDLQPVDIHIRYGQGPIDSQGYVNEGFRVQFNTDRGPFALTLTPAGCVEVAQHLLAAFTKLPEERARWDAFRNGDDAS